MTSATSPPRKPGRVGFWIGGLLIVLAVAAGLGGVALGVQRFSSVFDGFERVSIRSGGEVEFTEAGTYQVFLERDGISTEGPVRDRFEQGTFGLVREGTFVPLQPAGTSELTYSFGGHEGRRIGEFVIPEAGSYRLRPAPAADAGSELAIGTGNPARAFVPIVGGLIAGFVLGITGVVVLIVSGVRRSRYNRGAGSVPPGAPGPWGPPPPGGGWGAPAGAGGAVWPPAPGAPGPGWNPPPTAPGAWTPPAGPPPGSVPGPGPGWPPAGPGAPGQGPVS